MQKVTPFLMFTGKAEEAIQYYQSVFTEATIKSISRYEKGPTGAEGKIMSAVLTIAGQELMCFDSPVEHGFAFTPAISFFITCQTAEEVDSLFEKLGAGGQVLMPLDKYPFSERFAWVNDKFGISWQLNVERK